MAMQQDLCLLKKMMVRRISHEEKLRRISRRDVLLEADNKGVAVAAIASSKYMYEGTLNNDIE